MHSVAETMEEKSHHCKTLPESVCIEKDDGYFGNGENWVLVVTRSATEEDLEENHYLEEVGETIWCTVAEISHCPYCGKFLGEVRGGDPETAHFDFSSWESKRC
jgi:hypothetical protein